LGGSEGGGEGSRGGGGGGSEGGREVREGGERREGRENESSMIKQFNLDLTACDYHTVSVVCKPSTLSPTVCLTSNAKRGSVQYACFSRPSPVESGPGHSLNDSHTSAPEKQNQTCNSSNTQTSYTSWTYLTQLQQVSGELCVSGGEDQNDDHS